MLLESFLATADIFDHAFVIITLPRRGGRHEWNSTGLNRTDADCCMTRVASSTAGLLLQAPRDIACDPIFLVPRWCGLFSLVNGDAAWCPGVRAILRQTRRIPSGMDCCLLVKLRPKPPFVGQVCVIALRAGWGVKDSASHHPHA
jgi:hypothetical protein